MSLVHASCVAISGRGVLLTGPPGSGKSDLALRLADGGAALVADDQTLLSVEDGVLVARCPPQIRGLIEARHAGLLRLPFAEAAPVALHVRLGDAAFERLPEPATADFLGCTIRSVALPAFEASTPAKIRLLLAYPLDDGFLRGDLAGAPNSRPKMR